MILVIKNEVEIQLVFSLTRAQKLLMASGGNPRLLRAVRVKRRGSSQSLQKQPNNKCIDDEFPR